MNEKMNEKLDKINLNIDELALQRKLDTEAEHLKRIICTKFVRFYATFTGAELKINTRVLNEVGIEDKTYMWSLVKRVCVCINTEFKQTVVCPCAGETTCEGKFKKNGEEECKNIFEWTKLSKTNGFEVQIGESCRKIQIMVKLENQRSIKRLNKELSLFLNKETDTKFNIIKDLYKYVNTKRLNDYSTSNVNCDEELQKVFGVKSFNFNDIGRLIEPHLHPIFYCVIDVVPGIDGIWDIEIETDDLSQMPVLYPKNINLIEKKLEEIQIQKRRIADRIKVLKDFGANPSRFISKKLAFDSDGAGVKSVFYDDLSVQNILYELIKRKEE